MAVQGDNETQVIESMSPVGDCENGKDEEHGRFENTVTFDDTLALSSPLEESQLEKLGFDTIVVDDPDDVDNVGLQTACEYEEVVPDSEDEGISRTKLSKSADGLSVDKPDRRVIGDRPNSQKGQFYTLDEQVEYLAPDSCGSIDDQQATDSLEGIKKLARNFGTSDLGQDNKFARMNCSGSQEPGGSSPANALNFVNHFLSLNNVASSPRTDSMRAMKGKSPHVSSAKGIHSLAKRIILGTRIGEKGIFNWDDGDRQGEADFFGNRSEISYQEAMLLDSSGAKSSANKDKQKQEFANLKKEITVSAPLSLSFPVYGSEEVSRMVDVKIDNNSVLDLKEDRHIKKSEESQQFDDCRISDSLDTCDFGFNTQMAAEAIEALAYAPPAHCRTGDAHYVTWDNLEGSGVNFTQIKANTGHPYPQANVCLDVGGVSGKQKQRTGLAENFHVTSSSSQKRFENQELDPKINMETKIRRTKSLAVAQSIVGSCAHARENSERSAKVIKHGKVEGVNRQNNSKACENNISSIAAGQNSAGKGNDQIMPVAFHTINHMSEGEARMCQGQFDRTAQRKNNAMEGGIITYKRRRNSLSANPQFASKCPKLHLGTSARTINSTNELEQTSVDAHSLTSYLRSDSWKFPKRKRTLCKVQSNSVRAHTLFASLVIADENVKDAHSKRGQRKLEENVRTTCLNSKPWDYPTRKRSCRVGNNSNRSNNLYSAFVVVKEKESNSHSKKSQTRSEENLKTTLRNSDMKERLHSVRTQLLLHPSERNSVERRSRVVDSNWDLGIVNMRVKTIDRDGVMALRQSGEKHEMIASSCSRGAKQHCKFEVLSSRNSDHSSSESNTTAISAKGGAVVTSNNLSDKCHNKTSNNQLKSSSKELARLGVPISKPEFTWKDLRRWRIMTYVRVLFSQHLGDVIVKKQKKILTKLGASVASCLMDATHFVADRFIRTRNMLEAIALSKPVVTHLWLESCSQATSVIDESSYLLRDAKKEKEIGFRLPVSLAQAMQNPLLKGRRVFITSSIKPDKEMLTCLVKTVQGQVVESWQISSAKDQILPDDLLILSCEEDHAICLPFLEKGAAVYDSELLLNGIVVQKLEYGRHQLFVHHGTRNRRKSRSRR